MKLATVQYSMSAIALLLAIARLLWPWLTIDAITAALVVIAFVPWLGPLFKSLELPGGWKIEFRDFERAQSRAESAGLLAKQPPAAGQYAFQLLDGSDPILVLAGLRIEIETVLVEMAEIKKIPRRNTTGAVRLLRLLSRNGLFSFQEEQALANIMALNAAVHAGGSIDHRAAAWALDVGPRLLHTLEQRR